MVILPAFFQKQEKQFKVEYSNADFVVMDDGRIIAYEIMISPAYTREYNNLCRNLHENGFDGVVFLAQTSEELEKLRAELIKRHGGLLPDAVEFKLVRDLLT